jgi:hypothetical protein
MLRSSSSLILAAALAVAGCPVYDDECVDDSACGPGYVCHVPTRECVSSGDSNAGFQRCAEPNDCDERETCDRFGRCRTESCGEVGCVSGYRCEVQDGFEHCMRGPGTGGTGGEAGATNEGGSLNQGGGAG